MPNAQSIAEAFVQDLAQAIQAYTGNQTTASA
jgi:hypothetical protein